MPPLSFYNNHMAKTQAISSHDALLSSQETPMMDPVFKEILAQTSTTPTNRPSVIFKLRNAPNGKVHIDGIDDVLDPETGVMRRIRLIRGISEIWMDKQEKLDKSFIDKNRISLTFIQGALICDQVKDEAIIKAARLMNSFEGNPNRIPGKKRAFYEWNPAAQEKEAFEKEVLENEAVQLAMNMPFEKVKKHGLYLGISFTDEMGQTRTENGIRTLYAREAKRDPKRFKETMDGKEVELNYLIRRAILESKIDLGGNTGIIKWAVGGQICRLPHGRQPVEYLIEFAMLPTKDSELFVERLQTSAN